MIKVLEGRRITENIVATNVTWKSREIINKQTKNPSKLLLNIFKNVLQRGHTNCTQDLITNMAKSITAGNIVINTKQLSSPVNSPFIASKLFKSHQTVYSVLNKQNIQMNP